MSKVSCTDFGRLLLRTNDLDPVYVVLHRASLPDGVLRPWLVAYWAFYHAGTASWAASVNTERQFWDRMRKAAGSKEYPRSSERRHFRGRQAARSVEYLSSRGLAGLFADLYAAGPTAADVIATVREWVGFGPWVAFKAADMMERLGMRAVAFPPGKDVLYDSPRKGAADLWAERHGTRPPPANVVAWALATVADELRGLTAPPRHERRVNAQEAETVLCKWHSYLGGHYEPGEDVAAVRSALERFPNCPLAGRLLRCSTGPGGLWTEDKT